MSHHGDLRRAARYPDIAIAVLATAWFAGAAVYGWHLARRVVLGDFGCEFQQTGTSIYGEASWQWWYPGTACTYSGQDTGGTGMVTHPGPASGVIALLLVGSLVAFAVLVARSRRRARLWGSGVETQAEAIERP